MKRAIIFIKFLFVALIITGYSAKGQDEKTSTSNETQSSTKEKTELDPIQVEIPMSDLLLPNSSKSHYKGEGNDF